MAPPWGVGWRKCDTRASAAAHSRLTRSSIDVSRGIRKTIKKNITFWMPICLHFGSIWHPNWLHFGIMFRFSFWAYFRCVFFGNLQHFRSRKSSILVLSPTRRAIFRVFIKLQTNPKRTQHLSKMAPNINQKNLLKSRQKSIKNHISFFIDFYLQNGAKMSPKWEGKKWENLALGTLGGQGGPPRSPKGTRGVPEPQKWSPRQPQTPKIDPKRSPQTPKWCLKMERRSSPTGVFQK